MSDEPKKLKKTKKAASTEAVEHVPLTSYKDVPANARFTEIDGGRGLLWTALAPRPGVAMETGLYLDGYVGGVVIGFADLLRHWRMTLDDGATFQPAGMPASQGAAMPPAGSSRLNGSAGGDARQHTDN